MPRLSLWRENKGNDYQFFDRRISEMFTIGGTDIYIHKYLGPTTGNVSISATEPGYASDSAKNIQDLLFLENRDRKYDSDVYGLRGIYRVNDNDFDLQQFGLFLTGDTVFMVFHLNDMVETLGRKIIVGDVLELPHLKDYYPLDEGLSAALKRFYVVQDATRAAEGFAPTWYPHLWRIKCQPLVDSQEYKDIINKDTIDTDGDGIPDTSLGELNSTLNRLLQINDAVVTRAEDELPKSGYDTSWIYTAPVNQQGYPGNPSGLDASNSFEDASESVTDTSSQSDTSTVKVQGYLTGDGTVPNGGDVNAGIVFPSNPNTGAYYLRLDYIPNRLFRFDGRRWVKVEDAVRTDLTPGGNNKTQRSSFVNNDNVRYSNKLGWDAIRVADPYTPTANAYTSSFTLSSKRIVTKQSYKSTYGATTYINGQQITNTLSNSSGNLAITVSNGLPLGEILEYTVYANVNVERTSLSNALRPTSDN
jgi:hypothetical protein